MPESNPTYDSRRWILEVLHSLVPSSFSSSGRQASEGRRWTGNHRDQLTPFRLFHRINLALALDRDDSGVLVLNCGDPGFVNIENSMRGNMIFRNRPLVNIKNDPTFSGLNPAVRAFEIACGVLKLSSGWRLRKARTHFFPATLRVLLNGWTMLFFSAS